MTAKTGYEIVGFNTVQSETTSILNSEGKASINKNTTYYTITRKKVTVTFDKNAASSISETTKTCYIYNGDIGCQITPPEVTTPTGFEFIGWGTLKDSTIGTNANNNPMLELRDIKYYAITKSVNPYTATFTNQDSNAVTLSKSGASCYRYNGQTSCEITAPKMTAQTGYVALGFNQTNNATTSTLNSESNASISSNITYYTITKTENPIIVTFSKNGAKSISSTKEECYKYNGQTSCNIKSPTITVDSGGTVIGWNTSSNVTTSTWDVNTEKSFSTNRNYYAITQKTITITFHGNDKANFIANDSVNIRTAVKTGTCKAYNNDGCILKDEQIPLIIGEGAEHWGFSKTEQTNYTSPANTTFDVYTERFKSNTDLYVITSGFDYAGSETMISEKLLGNVVIEYDNKINLTVKNRFISYLDDLYSRWPEMFKHHGKLVLLEVDRYLEILPGTGGISYGGNTNSLSMIPVTATTFSDYDAGAMVHELGHAFENYYFQKLGVSLSEARVNEIWNKYTPMTQRPLRDYSYSSKAELIADMFEFKYTNDYNINSNACTANEWVNNHQYTCGVTSEMNNWIDKYRCIARNNYNEEESSCQIYN